METAPAPDPNDWRTWRRDGIRLFPPPGTTAEQGMEGMMAFSLARRGIDPARPRKWRRNIMRVLKKIDGRYQEIRFAHATERGLVDIRVRGGSRPGPSE